MSTLIKNAHNRKNNNCFQLLNNYYNFKIGVSNDDLKGKILFNFVNYFFANINKLFSDMRYKNCIQVKLD